MADLESLKNLPDVKLRSGTETDLATDTLVFGDDGNFVVAEELPGNVPTRSKVSLCNNVEIFLLTCVHCDNRYLLEYVCILYIF